MEEMGFGSCKADPDVWFRPAIHADVLEYYQYVLLYTDGILAIMEKSEKFLCKELGTRFTLKEKTIGPPLQYLGNKVSQVTLRNGVTCWSFSLSKYIQNTVNNVENYLLKQEEKLPCTKSIWLGNHCPKIDVSSVLSPALASYYQSLIGILRWIVELGRANAMMETSAMVSMMEMLKQGHVDVLF